MNPIQRKGNFDKRIGAGLKDGSINKQEQGQLRQLRAGVGSKVAEAKQDGKIDDSERQQIRAAQNQVSGDR